jgi:hypothetical protein
MATGETSKKWETYEQVAGQLLQKMSETLGLDLVRVEEKQKLLGKSGTTWAVDGKGVKTEDEAIILIECRRYTTSKLDQEAIGAFAYRVDDVGAAGGIIVTPIGVQEGGQKVAAYEGIHIVRLDENSTTTDYVLGFLDKVFHGASAHLKIGVTLSATGIVMGSDKP